MTENDEFKRMRRKRVRMHACSGSRKLLKNFGYGSQMTGQELKLMRIHDSLCGREYLFMVSLTTLQLRLQVRMAEGSH